MDIEKLTIEAKNGTAQAQNDLGVRYMMGDGLEVDEEKAAELFLLASKQEHPYATANLARCYLFGVGIEKDVEKAIALLTKTSELGVPNAQVELGRCYLTGNGVASDVTKAFKLFFDSSKQGYPFAYFELGKCCAEGVGLEKNLIQAIEYFTRAAEHGVENSWMYVSNSIDIVELTKLAEDGNDKAQFFLYYIHKDSKRVKRNLREAYKWLKKSASQNNLLALLYLGEKYFKDRAYFSAEQVLEKAAKTGAVVAKSLLKKVQRKIIEKSTFFLAKITDKQWADKFLDGEVYMQCLNNFTNYENKYRGDAYEGAYFSESTRSGMHTSAFDNNKIFCLYSLDYDFKKKQVAQPDERIKDFGDTAVLILDSNEFLRRVKKAVEEKYRSSFWLGYRRVTYGYDREDEFDKRTSYSWQKEFRISLDLSEGRVAQKVIDKCIVGSPEGQEIDNNPDSLAESLTINIGSIRDISKVVSVDDFVSDVDSNIDKNSISSKKVVIQVPARKRMLHLRPFWEIG